MPGFLLPSRPPEGRLEQGSFRGSAVVLTLTRGRKRDGMWKAEGFWSVKGSSKESWKRVEQLWAEEKPVSALQATEVNSHFRLRGHLQTCQNAIHVRIHILVLHTLLIDVKALPRFAT